MKGPLPHLPLPETAGLVLVRRFPHDAGGSKHVGRVREAGWELVSSDVCVSLPLAVAPPGAPQTAGHERGLPRAAPADLRERRRGRRPPGHGGGGRSHLRCPRGRPPAPGLPPGRAPPAARGALARGRTPAARGLLPPPFPRFPGHFLSAGSDPSVKSDCTCRYLMATGVEEPVLCVGA